MINENTIDPLKKLSFWDKLSNEEKNSIISNSIVVNFKKHSPIHRTDDNCAGLIFVTSGQIRTYIMSPDGREITLYRLFKNETCILSASCVLDSIAFDVMIESVEDTTAILIPITIFNNIVKQNIHVELFAYKSSTERFSDVMWTMQQILFMGADRRLAIFLWDEIIKNNSSTLNYTHEEIARYIGSAREVVSRMLKYFSKEGIVELSRKKIFVIDKEKLKKYL